MSQLEQNKIRYTVACVNEFARSKSLTTVQAFFYLLEHKDLSFNITETREKQASIIIRPI